MASPAHLLPQFLTTPTSKVQANWAQAAAAVHKRYGHETGAALKRHPVFDKLGSGSGSGVDLGSGSSNSIGCDFCNMAVQYIKMALQNNQTTAQIEAVSGRVTHGLGVGGRFQQQHCRRRMVSTLCTLTWVLFQACLLAL
jgi:hypothetical protein